MEDLQQSFYAVIPADVRYDARLTANSKLLYGEITALCNMHGFCWAKNEYFAKLYGTSERSIQRWIDTLVSCGYIIKNYLRDDSGALAERCISIQTYRLSPRDKNVVSPTTKMSSLNKDEYFKYYNNNPPYPPKGISGEKNSFSIDDYGLSEAMKSKVSEWVEYKKEQHKFKYSEQGFKSFIKQLQNYIESCGENNVIKAIDEAMANGYKGVVWDVLKRKKKDKPEKSYTSEQLNGMFNNLDYEDL